MTTTACAGFETRGTAARYVAGATNFAETEEFERHLIGCQDCQQVVRLGAAIRHDLSTGPGASVERKRRSLALTAGVLALAAGIVFVAGRSLLDARHLHALGAVGAPPPYGGVPVRDADGDSLFDAGMRLYLDRRYDEARAVLIEARSRGADSVPSSFFVGVMELMRREPDHALTDLRVVLGRGESPYRAESHYYLAKAWLQLGRADSATAHLNRAADTKAPIAVAARALADSVSEVRR